MQRRWIKLFLVLSFFGSIAQAVEMNRTVVELPEALHDKVPGLNPGYILARPSAPAGEEKPALLIYLHGGGSGGNHISERLGRNAPVKYWNQQETHPFIIVAPQCFPKNKWKAETLQVLLEHLKETVEFDHDRIYLTGFSMGAYGTWLWAATYPENFAAIVPMGGGIGNGGPTDVSPELDQWLDNLSTIPTWIFHGGGDTVVPPERSERMYQGLKERGLKELGLTIYPNARHVYAQDACKDPMVYEWMLRQSRVQGDRRPPEKNTGEEPD
jgi:predicted peptidase